MLVGGNLYITQYCSLKLRHQYSSWCCLVLVVVHCVVAKSCPTFCDPKNCSTPGFPVLHHLWSLLKLMSIELVMPFNHLILCRPCVLLPSIFPRIRTFSSESVFPIRWPKYWSFSCIISPSNEYSGLISFMID